MVERAAKGNTYSGSWRGPAPTGYEHWNQTLAVYALVNGALTVRSTAPSDNGTIPESPNKNNDGGHASRIGPLVGGTVGGLVLVSIVVGLWLFLRRRRATQNGELAMVDRRPKYEYGVPIPYTIPAVRVTGSRLGSLRTNVETPRAAEYVRKPPLGNAMASNARRADIAAAPRRVLTTVPNPEGLSTDTIVRLLLEREGRAGLNHTSPPTYATDRSPRKR